MYNELKFGFIHDSVDARREDNAGKLSLSATIEEESLFLTIGNTVYDDCDMSVELSRSQVKMLCDFLRANLVDIK